MIIPHNKDPASVITNQLLEIYFSLWCLALIGRIFSFSVILPVNVNLIFLLKEAHPAFEIKIKLPQGYLGRSKTDEVTILVSFLRLLLGDFQPRPEKS